MYLKNIIIVIKRLLLLLAIQAITINTRTNEMVQTSHIAKVVAHRKHSGPSKAALHCNNCDLKQDITSERRKPHGNQKASNNDIICFACNKTGHKRSRCPLNKATHRAAAMQQVNTTSV